nr:hypothetical protein [Tanacetum cinerariifolium]
MANDEEDHVLVAKAPTEFALMANTSTKNKVFNNSFCSKDCKKNNDSLNSKITNITDKLFDAKNMIYHYKLTLAQVESRLVEYKEREVKYIEKIRTLEFYDKGKIKCIETLKKELETLKKEKEVVDGKLAGLLTASKDLDNLIESQRKFPPVNRKFSTGDRNFPTVNKKFSTASRKFPTCSTKGPTADMGMKGKAIKSSACWSWKPSQNLSNKGPKNNSVSVVFKKYTYNDTHARGLGFKPRRRGFPLGAKKEWGLSSKAKGSSQNHINDKGYWDSGCSRHMAGNISYLSDYEPFDGGYVSFGQGGCKITGKGTIKTDGTSRTPGLEPVPSSVLKPPR